MGEEITGKGTVPNVWLDGKFIGGSEEVIAGVEGDMFDGVEKKEIIVLEEEPKIPCKQAENAFKVGDKIPDVGLWQGFPNDNKVSLAGIGKDQNILVVGCQGLSRPHDPGSRCRPTLSMRTSSRRSVLTRSLCTVLMTQL